MESLAIRIRQSRKLKGFSQKQLAEKIGVSSSAISQYESGSHFHSEPSIKNLIKLTKTLNVSFEWLTTGRGIKEIGSFLLNEKTTYKSDNKLISLTKQQKDILLLFDRLPNDWKEQQLLTLKAITVFLER